MSKLQFGERTVVTVFGIYKPTREGWPWEIDIKATDGNVYRSRFDTRTAAKAVKAGDTITCIVGYGF